LTEWKVAGIVAAMEERPDIDADEARRALAALGDTRRRMAQRAHWSLPRHIAAGALIGLLVASYALPTPAQLAALAVVLAATALLVAADRRRDGFFVNGYRAGRTRRVAFLFVGIALTGLIAGIVGKLAYGLVWAPVAAGAIVAVLGTLASLAWERAYRADLAGTP
jgi:putative exporter of polyketide antibiotics